ncbi:hypothetical protein RND71_031945 [Anisodus tanguticus]|uniref:Uncharacterized protein n=1 Tax=Anisodus tanguticus TaxID=243964 RepID=A0AAE1RBN5_9SOLA|nr:hypothetical protein RND71_031945 [Anisodus tanguticus]
MFWNSHGEANEQKENKSSEDLLKSISQSLLDLQMFKEPFVIEFFTSLCRLILELSNNNVNFAFI